MRLEATSSLQGSLPLPNRFPRSFTKLSCMMPRPCISSPTLGAPSSLPLTPLPLLQRSALRLGQEANQGRPIMHYFMPMANLTWSNYSNVSRELGASREPQVKRNIGDSISRFPGQSSSCISDVCTLYYAVSLTWHCLRIPSARPVKAVSPTAL
jgi:hypothetical protein